LLLAATLQVGSHGFQLLQQLLAAGTDSHKSRAQHLSVCCFGLTVITKAGSTSSLLLLAARPFKDA
jgi:hypothetical protein